MNSRSVCGCIVYAGCEIYLMLSLVLIPEWACSPAKQWVWMNRERERTSVGLDLVVKAFEKEMNPILFAQGEWMQGHDKLFVSVSNRTTNHQRKQDRKERGTKFLRASTSSVGEPAPWIFLYSNSQVANWKFATCFSLNLFYWGDDTTLS